MPAKKESFKGLPAAELKQKVETARQQLWQFKQQVAGQQLKNYRKIRDQKKQIARLLTELNAIKGETR